jgi:RNA polymerase primary sigma factor
MAVSKKETNTTRGRTPRRSAKRTPMAIEAEQGHELLDLYIAELSRTPVLAAEAQKELARKMRHPKTSPQDKAVLRAELISANLRFAFSVAKQYQNRGLSLEDLVGEANAGLCRAADKYDPDVGVNFISYAVWWIKQALHASITTKGRSVRLPLGRAGDLSRVVKAQAALRSALGREPTHDEIGRMCGLSAEIAGSLTALVQPERSLDEPLESGSASRGGGSRTLASVIGSDEESEERLPGRLEDEDRGNALRLALEPLPARDRQVLIMYYGLEGHEAKTLEEIGNILGVTRERVRQLRDRALAALRSGEATEVLRDWAA